MSSIYPESGAGAPREETPSTQIDQVKEGLGQAGEAVRAEAAHFAEAARDEVTEQVEAGTQAVTGALDGFAEAIRKASEELSQQDQTFAARFAGQAAEGLQAVSRTLSGKSPEEMLHTARDFGRDNPTAFLAGAVLAGVALGRFARSSAERANSEPPTPASAGLAPASADPEF